MPLPPELVGKKPPPNRFNIPPPPGIRRIIWRWRIWLEATFAISMLDYWEITILYLICAVITALFWFSVFTYFPGHYSYMARRFSYYVYGDETVDAAAALRAWIGTVVRDGIDTVKGAVGGVTSSSAGAGGVEL